MLFMQLALVPNRVVRLLAAEFGPTRLRYRCLTPNYETFWGPDSDAVNSIDSHEALLRFLSRDDECLDCGNLWDQLFGFLRHSSFGFISLGDRRTSRNGRFGTKDRPPLVHTPRGFRAALASDLPLDDSCVEAEYTRSMPFHCSRALQHYRAASRRINSVYSTLSCLLLGQQRA